MRGDRLSSALKGGGRWSKEKKQEQKKKKISLLPKLCHQGAINVPEGGTWGSSRQGSPHTPSRLNCMPVSSTELHDSERKRQHGSQEKWSWTNGPLSWWVRALQPRHKKRLLNTLPTSAPETVKMDNRPWTMTGKDFWGGAPQNKGQEINKYPITQHSWERKYLEWQRQQDVDWEFTNGPR